MIYLVLDKNTDIPDVALTFLFNITCYFIVVSLEATEPIRREETVLL